MKKIILRFVVIFSLAFGASNTAKADLWGGDVAVLVQILANALKQYQELKEIVGTAKDSLDMARDLNSGINTVLNLVETSFPEVDLSVYKDWEDVSDAVKDVKSIYGTALKSKDSLSQGHLDESIAQAIVMYNKLNKHSKEIDKIGERISVQSRHASPKGAARLAAQATAVGIHVQNQSLRTQSAILKLEAQNSALRNKKEKDETRFFLKSAKKLKKALSNHKPTYKTPRF